MKTSIILVLSLVTLTTLSAQVPTDPRATKKTAVLLSNLKLISEQGFMFGHEDDLAYGVGWREVEGQSDVKLTTGSYPAVYGWDLGRRLTGSHNIDSVSFDLTKKWIRDVYKRGGINTISWHLDNLTTESDSWDKTPSVADILPGGKKHDIFRAELDLLADFMLACKTTFTKVPIIFRPWHEHNGDWFWWGKGNCSEEEYQQLFRYTVDYLRNERNIHHLLIAFSPDRSRLDPIIESNYLYGYPGDDYVDIIGLDNYGDIGRGGSYNEMAFIESLKLITQIARNKNKVSALTETGLESIPNPEWFTKVILEPIQANDNEIDIAWMLVWRNFDTKHHYASFPGHPSEADFIKFRNDPGVFFEDDLNNPYKKGKILR